MRQTLLPLLSTGLVVFSGHAPAAAQIFGGSSNPRNVRQLQRQAVTGPATTGTVPGVYYDPSGKLSPSLSQLQPAEEGGFFALPSRYQSPALQKLGYNPSRAWAKGATPDRMLKMGDLQQSKQFSSIGKMSMRQMATMAGTDIERVPLSQIPLVAEMTVGELYKVYPQLQNVPLKEISFLSQTLSAAARDPKALGNAALDMGSQRAVQELAAIDPRLANVPLASIVRGDLDGALSQSKAAAAKLAAAELTKVNPMLANVPVGDILNGNWRGVQSAALDMGQKALVQELAKNPALEGIPLAQLAEGDWGGAITELQQGKLKDLIKDVPALQNLPVDQAFPMINGAIAGDWQSVSLKAVELGWELAGDDLLKAVPELQNLPLGSLPIDGLSIASLPGLIDRPLETLPNIASKYLTKLPGLSKVPVDKLPLNYVFAALRGDLFGRLDIAYAGPVETPITSVVTGGTKDQKFKPEPCREKRCPHFELDNVEGGGPPGKLSGKAWVEGKAQMVPGGKGLMAKVNNGKEPTGIPVWGLDENVKLSLEKIQEGSNGQPSTAEVWANVQVCFDAPFIGEQCTPHFIPIPLPIKVKEGGLMIIASAGKPPDMIRQARAQARSQYESQFGAGPECVPATVATTDPKVVASAGKPPASKNMAQENLQRYLARIAAGESAGGRNIGPNPETGAYGEYQFIRESRDTMIREYGIDPWSTNKAVRDKAALKWIELYGQEKRVNILGAIQKGDFQLADRVLGRSQFTSLPGGAEESPIWKNASNLQKYGPAGNGRPFPVFAGPVCAQAPGGGGPFVEGSGKGTGKLITPTPGPVTSWHGWRMHPIYGTRRWHAGIDIGAPRGTPVKAADGGVIVDVQSGCVEGDSRCGSGYGNLVRIRHSNGLETVYTHLQNVNVRIGQKTDQGQNIGTVGNTGGSTGPHLHFEVRKGPGWSGNDLNPLNFIRR
jgi:murein DD-endopeptidase MepM/ murein hydrolase activator NlpD